MRSKISSSFIILLLLFCLFTGCSDRILYFLKGDVPRYPHAEIVELMHLRDGFYAELLTKDPGKKVLAYYKDHMTRLGWGIRVERNPESPFYSHSKSGAFLAFFKDSTGLMIDTSTPTDGGKTQIAMFIGDTHE